MIKAIIFDFDMTLVDSLGVGNKAIEELRNKHKLEINMTEKEIWSTPHIPLMKKISEMNNNNPSWEEVMRLNRSAMERYYSECIINEIEHLIKITNSGIYLGIISNNSREIINIVLTKNGNHKLKFGDVLGNEDCKDHSSKAGMINFLLEKYNFNKEDVMYVGDSEGDITSAVLAGVIPVGVVTGLHTKEELKKAGASIILNNLKWLLCYFTK